MGCVAGANLKERDRLNLDEFKVEVLATEWELDLVVFFKCVFGH